MYRCFLSIFTCLLLLSCTEVPVHWHDEEELPVPVLLTPRIIGSSNTRAVDMQWQVGDQLGVFMLKKDAPLQANNIIDDAHNRCFQVSDGGESAHLISGETEDVMYYPADGSPVDFVAYYPYSASIEYTYPVRVDNQTDFPAIDLLYGTATGNKQSGNVVVYMLHRLSKIRILLKAPGLSAGELSDLQFALHGMPLASGFDLATTSLDYLNENGAQEVGNITTQTIVPGASYEAIILPQEAGVFKGRMISLMPHDVPLSWSIPDGTSYLPGKQYTYTFTLSEGGGLEFEDVIIRDWIDDDLPATAVEMVTIPGGTFLMGSSDGSGTGLNTTVAEAGRHPDETLREVSIDPFIMSRYPITNAQYAAFLNSIRLPEDGIRNGDLLIDIGHSRLICTSTLKDGLPSIRWYPAPGMDEHPVTGVSWHGAQAYAVWQGGSLLTEEQWEYACRGGITPPSTAGTAYSFGNETERLIRYAWYAGNNNTVYGNSLGTKAVGERLMNPFTLYDMHGNVWEWCQTEYEHTDRRVLRGGAFDSPAEDCRSARRHSAPREETAGNIGFRIRL